MDYDYGNHDVDHDDYEFVPNPPWKPMTSLRCVGSLLEMFFSKAFPEASAYVTRLVTGLDIENETTVSGPHQRTYFRVTPRREYYIWIRPVDEDGFPLKEKWKVSGPITCSAPESTTTAGVATTSGATAHDPWITATWAMGAVLLVVLVLFAAICIWWRRRRRPNGRYPQAVTYQRTRMTIEEEISVSVTPLCSPAAPCASRNPKQRNRRPVDLGPWRGPHNIIAGCQRPRRRHSVVEAGDIEKILAGKHGKESSHRIAHRRGSCPQSAEEWKMLTTAVPLARSCNGRA